MAQVKFKNKARFTVNLSKFKDLVAEQHAILLRKVAFQLLGLIVEKTPVKTGRAQNNWQVAVDTSAGDAVIEGKRSSGAVQADGLSKLATVKAFSTILLYNNVEYIVFLEEGSSTQAPRGMVQISILEVEAQFR